MARITPLIKAAPIPFILSMLIVLESDYKGVIAWMNTITNDIREKDMANTWVNDCLSCFKRKNQQIHSDDSQITKTYEILGRLLMLSYVRTIPINVRNPLMITVVRRLGSTSNIQIPLQKSDAKSVKDTMAQVKYYISKELMDDVMNKVLIRPKLIP